MDKKQLNSKIDKLKELIKECKKDFYIQEYQDKASDTDALGILISQYFEWNGSEILKTAYSAFEDSNFHTFNEKMINLWKSENA